MYRVTQMTFYRQNLYDIMRLNQGLYEYNQQASSGKRINAPSDDSLASIPAQNAHRRLEEVDQYKKSVDFAKSWLSQSNSQMDALNQQLARVKELCEQMSTGTYDENQRAIVATEVEQIMGQIIAIGNTSLNGYNIFAGTDNDVRALSLDMEVQGIAEAKSGNLGDGDIYGEGAYTGIHTRNIDLTVETAPAGGAPAPGDPLVLRVEYVDDLGRLITDHVEIDGLGSGSSVHVGDGVYVSADSGPYVKGDKFTLGVGRHQGNEEELDVQLSSDNRMRYNYTLDQILGQEGHLDGEWANILDLLAGWRDALLKDSREQEYFEAVSAITNNITSTAGLSLDGTWRAIEIPGASDSSERARKYDSPEEYYSFLNSLNMDMQVGGPIQSRSAAGDLAYYRNFTVDAGYGGGIPGDDNPMTVNYEFWNGAAWVAGGPVVFSGTGEGAAQSINDAGVTVSLSMVDSAFDAGEALPSPGSPLQSANTAEELAGYRNFTVSTAAVPPYFPASVDYEYWDGSNWVADTVNLAAAGVPTALFGGTASIYSDVGLDPGVSIDSLPRPPLAETTPSQGPPPVNLEMTYTYRDVNGSRRYNTVILDGTGEDGQVRLGGMDRTDDVTSTFAMDPNLAFNDATSPLTLKDDIKQGAFEIWVYENGQRTLYTVDNVLPTDTLNTLALKINTAVGAGNQPVATVENNRLRLTSTDGIEFAFVNDTSGALEALGLDFGGVMLEVSEDGSMDNADRFSLTLEQYHSGQDASQKMLPEVEKAMEGLLQYVADAGSRLNRLEVRNTLLGDDVLRSYDRLERTEDADLTEVTTQLKTYEVLLQAALQSTATVSARTLADYL